MAQAFRGHIMTYTHYGRNLTSRARRLKRGQSSVEFGNATATSPARTTPSPNSNFLARPPRLQGNNTRHVCRSHVRRAEQNRQGRIRTVDDVDDDAELASEGAVVDEAHAAGLDQSPVRLQYTLRQCTLRAETVCQTAKLAHSCLPEHSSC